MGIYINRKKATLYKGDSHPAQLFMGNRKIAGYSLKSFFGQDITMNGTYNDTPEEIIINGGYTPSKNLFDIDAFLALNDNSTYYSKNENGELVQLKTDYRTNTSLFNYVTLPAGNYMFSYSNTEVTKYQTYVNGVSKSKTKNFTLTETSTIGFKFYENAGTVLGHIQIEEGLSATEYEPYTTPTNPVLTWNNEEIIIPYVLYQNNSVKVSRNQAVLQAEETTDITQTEIGQKLLSLKTVSNITTASVSEGSLNITVKTSV